MWQCLPEIPAARFPLPQEAPPLPGRYSSTAPIDRARLVLSQREHAAYADADARAPRYSAAARRNGISGILVNAPPRPQDLSRGTSAQASRLWGFAGRTPTPD